MADDADRSDGGTTDPLPAVDFTSPESGGKTIPMPMAQSDDEIPTNPRQGVDDDVAFDALITGKMAAADPTLAEPEDETGYIDARGLGAAPDHATTKLPARTVMADLADPAMTGEDETSVGSVTDDAIVRIVVLPEIEEPPTMERPVPQNATRAAQLMAAPPNPAPPRQPGLQPKPAPDSGGLKPWRAPSGFWRKGSPTAAAVLQQLPANEVDDRARQKRAYALALAMGAVWLPVTAGLALASWMDPSDMLLLGLFSMIPTAIVVGGLTRPDGRAPGMSDLKLLVQPLAIALFLILVLPLPWQIGYFRLVVRPLAAASPTVTAKALADRSDAVAAAECSRLAGEFPRARTAETLAAGLPGRPEVARGCLSSAGEVAPELSERLVEIWGRALADKRTAPATACDVASTMTALERPAGEVETRLLSCIMNAPPEVRACCGDALAAANEGATPDWVAKIEARPAYVPDEPTAASLLALTFGHDAVSEEQRAVVKKAGFEGPAAQRMAIVFACASTKAGSNLGDEFVASLAGCSIDPETYARDREAWIAVCDRADDRVIRRRQDPRQSLCEAAADIATEGASIAAHGAVFESIKRARTRAR